MSHDDLRELLVQIDLYVEGLFAPPDAALETALRRSRAAGLPEIYVSRNEGKLLQLLAEIAGARRILEIGTLGGYSTIHLARSLPQAGSLILADNAIRGGSVLDPEDESARATHDLNEALAGDPRLSALVLPLIREGIDGIAMARVLGP